MFCHEVTELIEAVNASVIPLPIAFCVSGTSPDFPVREIPGFRFGFLDSNIGVVEIEGD